MTEHKKVSSVVIRRLPRYYRYLGDLLSNGVTRISSKDLSNFMNVTASQIRQDFNCFGGFGQQGYGYNVEYLYNEISGILGIQKGRTMIIVGTGNLGMSIAGYANFKKRGFTIVGLFDHNPDLYGKVVSGVEIMPITQLQEFLERKSVDIAVLTMPKESVQEILPYIKGRVKGIWNFSHKEILSDDGLAVENVHLSDSLMTLSCKIGRIELEKNKKKDK
ncbi:MAG: redox-sensing transcriptional repressor Rex [Bacillota bacterium]|nr:redox-sensing transcriptional repressor Rex [Bacillota bacterium]